jgi:lantibiotic modifying enzyme
LSIQRNGAASDGADTTIPREHENSWRPLLAGSRGELALAGVQEIVAALPDPSAIPISNASLADGSAGLAVLSTYLALSELDDGENAERFLAHAVEAVASRPMDASFYGGFTGVAWATAHIRKQFGEADVDDPTEAIDRFLRDYLDRSTCRDGYDLISGLVGLGVYAIERLPHATGEELLERVIGRLAETAERSSQGITWFTPPESLPRWQRVSCPNGYYNLGLAHGVPGVIAFLGQACASGVVSGTAESLLDGAVAWLLSQKSMRAHSTFSNWIAPGLEREDCRLAWCYGDLGVAAALLLAARSVTQSTWEHEAMEIARRAADRAPDQSGVMDAGLCHGAAGLAHVFNRMFQASGESWLGDAAEFWFGQTLDMRRPGEGVAGYSAQTMDEDGIKRWASEPGILTGAAGTALALLAAVSPVEPKWDQMFLVSIPTAGATERPARIEHAHAVEANDPPLRRS